MNYILLAEIKEGKNISYRVYSTLEDKVYHINKEQLSKIDTKTANFRLNRAGKPTQRTPGTLRLTKIIDGNIIEEYDSILDIGNIGLTLIKPDGITQYSVTREEFLEDLAGKVNNEHIQFTGAKRLNIRMYTDRNVAELYYEDISQHGENPEKSNEVDKTIQEENVDYAIKEAENTEENIKNNTFKDKNASLEAEICNEEKTDTQLVKEEDAEIKVGSEQSKNITDTERNSDFFSPEEITLEMNKVSTQEENIETVEEIRQNVTIQEDLSKKLDYNMIIASLYPMDKITLTYDIMKDIHYVILRVVDSNMDSTITTGLCKIFRDNERINCTVALIVFNDETQLATVQCLGQTDDSTKAVIGDIETICQTYGKWLKESKFIRL